MMEQEVMILAIHQVTTVFVQAVFLKQYLVFHEVLFKFGVSVTFQMTTCFHENDFSFLYDVLLTKFILDDVEITIDSVSLKLVVVADLKFD